MLVGQGSHVRDSTYSCDHVMDDGGIELIIIDRSPGHIRR